MSSPPPSSSSDPSSSSPSPPPPSDDSSSGNSPPPSSNSNDGNNSSSSSNNSPPSPDNNSSSSNNNPSPPPDKSNNNSSPPPSNNDNDNDNDNDNQSPPPPPNSSSSGSSNGSPSPPPSPPSSSHRALLPPKQGSSSKSSNGGSLSNHDKEIIAGVAAGAGLLLLMLIVFVCACAKRKKRKPRDHEFPNDYYNNGPQGNWHNNQMQKMPTSNQVSSEHGWPIAAPPLPPQMMSSSDAFSGPYSTPLPPPHPVVALGYNQSSFSFHDLAVATEDFSRDNLLGQGGFGYVHKGVLANGKVIAVKSLKANSGQGETEFQAEVDIISRVHHRHLVSLAGYCIAGPQRMLVYEFVPNNTLEYHLHGSGPVMDFSTRHKVALGSAKGFAYLHEDCHPRIIHRDIKVANILIDENFEAKVADFGLAKLANDTNTHVSTRIMGTFGYLAPEYAASGKLTEKSDVFSYGVVLLELITGKRPMDVNDDDDTLVEWARPILVKVADGGGFEELVDRRLGNNYDYQQMFAMVACAGASIRHSARRRPKMSQIVRALEGNASLEDLTEGMKVGNSGLFGSSGSSEYDTTSIQKDKARRSAGLSASQEFSSGEHGIIIENIHPDGDSVLER